MLIYTLITFNYKFSRFRRVLRPTIHAYEKYDDRPPVEKNS